MSEPMLLAFGCVVTFVAVAGVYVHVRESFAGAEGNADRHTSVPPSDEDEYPDAA